MDIITIKSKGRVRDIGPQKTIACSKCGGTEKLHLWNMPDPYDMGWGYDPTIICENCPGVDDPFFEDRGEYDPISHNPYLNAGGIEYHYFQWSSHPFICTDCNRVFNGDRHGYGHACIADENRDYKGYVRYQPQWCKDCHIANHLIDEKLIDHMIYGKYEGKTYDSYKDFKPDEFLNSESEFDRGYAAHLINSVLLINTLKDRVRYTACRESCQNYYELSEIGVYHRLRDMATALSSGTDLLRFYQDHTDVIPYAMALKDSTIRNKSRDPYDYLDSVTREFRTRNVRGHGHYTRNTSFICTDCHWIYNGEHGYATVIIDDVEYTPKFCMRCHKDNHVVDEVLLDIMVYGKGYGKLNLNRFLSCCSTGFEQKYAEHLIRVVPIINQLEKDIAKSSYASLKDRVEQLHPSTDRLQFYRDNACKLEN